MKTTLPKIAFNVFLALVLVVGLSPTVVWANTDDGDAQQSTEQQSDASSTGEQQTQQNDAQQLTGALQGEQQNEAQNDTQQLLGDENDTAQLSSTGTAKVEFLDWDDNKKELVTASIGSGGTKTGVTSYTVIDASSTSDVTLNAGWYVVQGGITFPYVKCNGAVHLILTDGCTLNVKDGKYYSCVKVSGEDNSLTIYGQTNQSGNLIAEGSNLCAGIGGFGGGAGGSNITINGGNVNATGGTSGAGIGGGNWDTGSNITINGGTVTATGGGYGAGIGGGYKGEGSNITINGGTVTATGGIDGPQSGGAGIGGGCASGGHNITINGGTVKATGATNGAGIGGGRGCTCSNIKINGGTVKATGGDRGAGIGGGYEASGHNITITGGTVTASGGDGASGIGNGNDCSGASDAIKVAANRSIKAGTAENPTKAIAHTSDTDIASSLAGKRYTTVGVLDVVAYIGADGSQGTIGGTIGSAYTLIPSNTTSQVTWNAGWYVVQDTVELSAGVICSGEVHLILMDGSNLIAEGAENCAGIQVSDDGNSLAIYGQTNQSGQLSATGGTSCAGIGGNNERDGSNITINGGAVSAEGDLGAAGIGGGMSGSGFSICINGGTVTATGGYSGAAGIGGGSGASGSNITIAGGTVTATGGTSGAGIGGGSGASGSNITIAGGTVNATGGTSGAGIGGGSGASGSYIYFNGGTVTATGGDGASGIGNGYSCSTTASSIKVVAGMVVKADGNNPPTSVISHTDDKDIASDLNGKRYATVFGTFAVTYNGTTTLYDNFMLAWKAMCDCSTASDKKATLKMYADFNAGGNFGDPSKSFNTETYTDRGALALPAGYFELDLNGHMLSRGFAEATEYGSVVKMSIDGIDLYIRSSAGTGIITGGNSSCSGDNSWRAGGIAMTKGKLTLGTGACISGNKGKQGSGVYVASDSELVLDGGTIANNKAGTNSGGVCVNGGTFTMNSGTISGNMSAGDGGGVTTQKGATMTMNGGTISGNTSKDAAGGGVYVNNYDGASTFTMTDGTISGNTSPHGGGVGVNGGTFTMSGGTVSGNTATTNSGGVRVHGGTFTMSDNSTISGNISNDVGGGVLTQCGGAFIMNGGTISGNTSKDDGGGVYVNNHDGTSTFTMTDGIISGNNATVSGSLGGGVYVYSGTSFNMSGGTITGNLVASNGGGVYNNGTMNVSGTAKITGNTVGAVSNNVFLPSGKKITVSAALTSGALVGVTTAATPTSDTPVAVTDTNVEDYSAYFFSDSTDYFITNNNNVVELQAVPTGAPTVEASISLDKSIAVNFYVKPTTNYPADKLYVKRTTAPDHTAQPSDSSPVALAEIGTVTDGVYKFVADKASASKMTDIVKVELFAGDSAVDAAKIKEYSFSVRQYCNLMIAAGLDANLVALCKATLDYGAASQVFFGVNTGDLANGGTWLDSNLPTTTIDKSCNVTKVTGEIDGFIPSVSLVLGSETVIKFKLQGLTDTGGYDFYLNGTKVTPENVVTAGEDCYITTSGLGSVDLDNKYVLRIDKKDTSDTVMTIEYSALSYAYRKDVAASPTSLRNVCKALYLYNAKAEDYIKTQPK